jgi:hypothetical protein
VYKPLLAVGCGGYQSWLRRGNSTTKLFESRNGSYTRALETILTNLIHMNKLEKTLVIVTLFALILKYLAVPGMSLFAVIGFLGLAVLYFYFGFALFNGIGFKGIFKKESYIEISKFKIFAAILVGVALSMICIGLLFKVQHWFGFAMYLYAGLTLSFVMLIIAVLKYNSFYKLLLIRLIPFSLLGALAMIIKI